MLIPHLHFRGDCEEAIALYEKAFHTKAESIVYNRDYAPGEDPGGGIAHAVMDIQGQRVFLNDRFGSKGGGLDCAVHLIVTFASVEELRACYGFLEEGSTLVDPFAKLPYSGWAGTFVDRFGVLWGFMAE